MSYVELHCHSFFSMLDGASSPEALVARAAALGHPALALTDHDELGGAVRFAEAARGAGIGGILGAEVTVDAGAPGLRRTHLTLLCATREGYHHLATLLTRARLGAPRGRPAVTLEQLAAHADGLVCLTGCLRGWVPRLVAQGRSDAACEAAATLADIFGGRVVVECWDHGLAEERAVVPELLALARALDLPWVVTNDVHYADPRARRTHDLLVALRHQRPLDAMGTRLRPNGEWYLKAAAQLARRWRHHPEGLAQTLAVAERCAFRLADLRPQLPQFPLPPGVTDDEYLARLAWHGAAERWDVLTDRHRAQLEHELAVIRQLGFAGYFLIVWDIVRFARREGILCQGRGSAANSAVCFCLGITAVDPIRLGLLFERFLSEGRREPPDIDIDFAHQERERVLQYVYRRYGREHAAMVCEHITWRGRSAVRDAARVLGFSPQQGEALAALSDRFSARATAAALRDGDPPDGPADPYADRWVLAVLGRAMVRGTEATTTAAAEARDARRAEAQARHDRQPLGWAPRHPRDTAAAFTDPHARDDHVERRNPVTAIRGTGPEGRGRALLRRAGLDPDDPRVRLLAGLVEGLHLAPRHRSIHVGGFVLTREPLASVVPVEPAAMPDRTVIQWEKDDLDPVGLVKIDLLGLGILTLIQACVRAIRQTRGITVDLARLDYADPAVYDDLCRADTVGVFQVESRAQMNTLPRLQPRCFYDLVVEVALIRPGPIQGDMVHPYLRRRAGLEPVTYPHPSLQPILERTLGVPLFQEQGMQVAITAAGFTPAEADELRRAMGHKRSHERMAAIAAKLVEGMRRNGIPAETARKIYHQINAFADYGFPESHAASFALLVYASAWLRHYYAPEFAAAILNAQPMGFYPPGTLIEDARRHGVAVRPVCLRQSAWDCTLEPAGAGPPALRLGLRLVSGLGARARDRLAEARAAGPFTGIADVVRRTGLDRGALRALAEAGAFDAFVAHEPPGRRRRAALWAVLEAERGNAGPLAPMTPSPEAPAIPPMSPWELTEADYRMTALSLNGHPVTHLRAALAPLGVATAAQLHGEAGPSAPRDGDPVVVAGLVICRQRPGTAKGFVFLTLEDETGMVNVVCTPQVFERQALLVSRAPLLLARGVLQVEGRVVNVRATEFEALEARVGAEHARSHDFR